MKKIITIGVVVVILIIAGVVLAQKTKLFSKKDNTAETNGGEPSEMLIVGDERAGAINLRQLRTPVVALQVSCRGTGSGRAAAQVSAWWQPR